MKSGIQLRLIPFEQKAEAAGTLAGNSGFDAACKRCKVCGGIASAAVLEEYQSNRLTAEHLGPCSGFGDEAPQDYAVAVFSEKEGDLRRLHLHFDQLPWLISKACADGWVHQLPDGRRALALHFTPAAANGAESALHSFPEDRIVRVVWNPCFDFCPELLSNALAECLGNRYRPYEFIKRLCDLVSDLARNSHEPAA